MVRWCKDCGAIVGDVDHDGRVNNGQWFESMHGQSEEHQDDTQDIPDIPEEIIPEEMLEESDPDLEQINKHNRMIWSYEESKP